MSLVTDTELDALLDTPLPPCSVCRLVMRRERVAVRRLHGKCQGCGAGDRPWMCAEHVWALTLAQSRDSFLPCPRCPSYFVFGGLS